MSPDRMRRVNEAVREVLSNRILEGFNDPRIGFVTVTAVETSPDLRHARVGMPRSAVRAPTTSAAHRCVTSRAGTKARVLRFLDAALAP